ncbi:cysteine desulfurase family protein [Halonatronum saccharophilum]|uniref:cysteine desulfurase family protein n=2 Tax=Halonatronum saccharophilum TaxID=150060 RepID=UPI00048460D8|nr:cysteine desulfurase family protein [Halonatronum saccharophilum]
MKEIYLDNAATTKPYDKVVNRVTEVLKNYYGNPSSLHRKGIEAEKIIKEARREIAKKLKVKPNEIYFTSGGTEGNNMLIKGGVKALKRYGNRIITSSIEHPSVLEVFNRLEEEGFDVIRLSVDKEGIIDIEELKSYLNDDTILVSIMGINNEIGTIQPLAQIGEILSKYERLYFHIDGVQTFGKWNLHPSKIRADLCTISSHKVHGPKGVGAVYIKDGSRITNLIAGSGQESGIRPGTENVPGIAGFAKATELIFERVDKERLYSLKELLVKRILNEIDDTQLNGPKIREGAPHIANISFAGIKGEVLIHSLEREGIYLSTGAACSSKQDTPSYILEAIGVSREMMEGAIRFSLSDTIDEDHINYTVDKVKENVQMLRKIMMR